MSPLHTGSTIDDVRNREKAHAIGRAQAYETKASALNGIESVKKNAAGATTDDQTG